MKKIFVAVALLTAALCANAEVVKRDTVAYTGEYKLERIEKVNEYGEINVRHVAILYAIVNKKGEPRKVTIDKATYQCGKIDALVYTTNDNGTRKIAKAIKK